MPDLDFTGLFGDLNVGSSLTALIDLIETVSASIVTEGEIGNDILTTELPLLNFSIDSKLGIVSLFRSISSVVAGLDNNLMQMQQVLDAELATLGFDVGLGADGKPVDSRVTVSRVNYDDPSNQDNRNDLVFGINIRKLVNEAVDTNIDLAAVMAGMDGTLAGPLAKLFAMDGNFKGAFEMSAGLMLDLVLNLDDVRAPKAFIGADSDLYVDFDVVTDQADMEVSFEVGGFTAKARTGTAEADPFVFEMVNRDGSALAPDANTRFLKVGLNGDGLSASKLSADQVVLELASEESLQVSVPVYAGIEHDTLGSFETKVVDFDLSFDPGQFISDTRPTLFVYQDANASTAAEFSAFRQTGVVAVSYQFADEFSFNDQILTDLMAAANQPLNFTDLFKQMQGVVNGVEFATTTVEVPFVGETIAGLIGIEDEADTVFSKLDEIFTALIDATTPNPDDETDGTVKSLDFINDKIRTLLFKGQQDQVDGLLFNAGFTFGRDDEDKLVANAVNVTFDLSFFALLQVHNIIDVDRTVRQTLRPADYLPREQLNMLRALGVDINLEMDPIDLLFNFDIGVKGSISLAIGGTLKSPTYTTTLHQGAGVHIDFGARAFVEQAQLKAGLTFVPGAQMTASVLDATFALDADGDVERDGAGRIIDDGLAVVEYVTSAPLVSTGNTTVADVMTLNTTGHAALMVPIYFPTKSAPLTGSADVIDDNFLTGEAGRYAKYASTKMGDWSGADVQRNAIFIGYDLNSSNLTNAADLVSDARFYYYVPNPMPQIGLGMFINDPLLLIDGLSSVLDALDKTIRRAPLFAMDLPFIGSELRRGANFVSSTLIDPLEDVLGDLSNLIRLEKSKRNGELTTVDLLQIAMYELFGEIEDATGDLIKFVAADGTALRSYDDVDVTLTDTFDDLRVGIRAMGNIFDPIDINLDVNGAVPGVPLSFASDAMIQLGMSYDMSLAFGVSYINEKLDFYIDTALENEIVVEAYADLNDDASLSATLGFLSFDGSNLLGNGHKELSAALTIDLKDPNAGNASKPELDDGRLSLINELRGIKFKDVVDAQFTARAEVSLGFVGSFGGSTQFPRFLTDFHYSQVFADVNLTTGVKQSKFGGTPEIILGDIRLDLGTFISNFAGPILKEVQKITKPTGDALQPVVDPLPVISDLLGSPTSALRLIEMFGGAGVAKYTTFFKVLKGIVDLINSLPSPNDANGVMIRFGDYVVSGATRDARNPQKFDQNKISEENKGRKINPQAQAASPKISTANSGRPTSDTSTKKASGKTKGFLSKSSALEGLRFPILNNPSTAIGVLTGASNVDLVVFDLPELYIEKRVSKDIWIWAPFLSATFGAGISATVNLSFGFDSRGLNLFRDSGWNNPEYLFFGLHARDWYDDGTERVELQIDMEITASAQVGGNFVIMSVKAGIAGGIFGTVKFDLNDVASREGTYDGKLYIDEIAYIMQRDPLGLFDVSAEFRAKVWAFVEIKLSLLFTTITIFEKKHTLVDVVLWRFGNLPIFNRVHP